MGGVMLLRFVLGNHPDGVRLWGEEDVLDR